MKTKILLVAITFVMLVVLSACMANPGTAPETQVSATPTTAVVCANTPTQMPTATAEAINTPTPEPTATEMKTTAVSSIGMVKFGDCGNAVVEIVPAPTLGSMNPYYFLDDRGLGRVATDIDLTGASNVSAVYRWWEAINANKVDGQKSVPWTHFIGDPKSSTSDVTFALLEPTKYSVTVPPTGATFQLTIARDMNAMKQLGVRNDPSKDPYNTALGGDWSQKSHEQLSWYVSGTGLFQTSQGWIDLTKYSAIEIAFPRNLKEGLVITLYSPTGGNFQIWQGSSENCFVEASQLHKDVPIVTVNTVNIWK